MCEMGVLVDFCWLIPQVYDSNLYCFKNISCIMFDLKTDLKKKSLEIYTNMWKYLYNFDIR